MSQFYWFLGHEQFQPEVLVKHAQLAEAAGFDGVLVSEHVQPWVDDAGAGGFAFATLAAIAQATKKIQLATAVTTPLFHYHPAIVAQAAATIDRLSGGRFALGVGTGENINEGPLGYAFPPYKERAERMSEALQIIRRLLDGEKLTFDGTYYQTQAAKLYSPPSHRVPVYLAAGGPKSATLAGEQADGLITSVKALSDAKGITEAAVQAAQAKDFTVITTHWSVYAQTTDEAWQALQAWRGLRAPSRATATDPLVLQREADAMPRDEILARYSQLDSPEAFVAAYQPLVSELGAHIVGIQSTSTDQEALIALVGREVLPRLRSIK